MLVGLCSLDSQFPLDFGQYLAIKIHYRVPGVGPLFKLWVSLILGKKRKGIELDSNIFLYNLTLIKRSHPVYQDIAVMIA